MRRELRSVRTEQVLGAVDDSRRGSAAFEGGAGDVLSGVRGQLGDAETIKRVIAGGWSNAYLYFAEATP